MFGNSLRLTHFLHPDPYQLEYPLCGIQSEQIPPMKMDSHWGISHILHDFVAYLGMLHSNVLSVNQLF